jgi:hypothetical protein
MFRKERKGLMAFLLAALLALPLGTAEAAGAAAGRTPAGLWSQLAAWLWGFWADENPAGSNQVDKGPYVDPFGKTGADQIDEGSSIDPFGKTGSDQVDAGSYVAPFGRTGSTSRTDAGTEIDPFG